MISSLETFEPRYLLAGVTMLIHGYNGNIDGWVDTAAQDIESRIGGTSAASIYVMNVKKSGGSLAVTSLAPKSGQLAYSKTSRAEMIVELDWSSVSDGSYSTGDVASVVSDYLLTTHPSIPPLVELPIQLIGHSRGASLAVAITKNLGARGVWVNQLTSLDPHPVDGHNDFLGISFGDQKMRVYDNVAFSDDYWRTDGDANNLDFDGEAVTGAHQGDLNKIVQTNFIGSAHAAVTAYYVGTIDTKTSDGGDHPVLSAWYGSSTAKPSRSSTGYIFSRVGGATLPLDGLSTSLGGTGARESVSASGAQWSNVLDLRHTGTATVTAGGTFVAQFKYSDRDSRTRVNFYFDTDRNPYNGAAYTTSKRFTGTPLKNGKVLVPTSVVNPGNYYLLAKSYDTSGHVKWDYGASTIQITAARRASVLTGKLERNQAFNNTTLISSADSDILGNDAKDIRVSAEVLM